MKNIFGDPEFDAIMENAALTDGVVDCTQEEYDNWCIESMKKEQESGGDVYSKEEAEEILDAYKKEILKGEQKIEYIDPKWSQQD